METETQFGSNNDDEINDSDEYLPPGNTAGSNKDDEINESDEHVPPESTGKSTDPDEKFNEILKKEFRLVLVGRTGSGKSATCNSILGRDVFKSECLMTSVTNKTQHGRRQYRSRDLIVIDTPGFFDTDQPGDKIKSEVVKCVGMLFPGPHAFLYTIKIGGRHTSEEAASLQQLIKLFGKSVREFLIIIFTAKEMLGEMELDTYLQNAPEEFKKILKMIGHDKCFAISNKLPNESSEAAFNRADNVENVEAILSKIDEMMQRPPPLSMYSNKMLEKAHSPIMKRVSDLEDEASPEFIREEIEDEDVSFKYLMASAIIAVVAAFFEKLTSCIIL